MGRAVIGSRLACLCIVVGCATKDSPAADWGTVVFRDDFDNDPGPPNPTHWIVNHPGQSWWTQGRTHFPDPLSTSGPFPRVERIQDGGHEIGVCVIEHHLYNPWDLGDPKEWFLGGEVHTVQQFGAGGPVRIEARVRSHATPDGLVTSFFTYGHDGSNSDEIDFEFLSNKTNDNATYADGDPMLTNPWNESHQCPEFVTPRGLDLSQWNTLRIYWFPQPNATCPGGGRVEWRWVDPVNGETLLRTEVQDSCVPDQPMAVYFNFWAPCYTTWGHGCDAWDEAADAGLQPVNVTGEHAISRFEIDYVEVRVPSGGEVNKGVEFHASDAEAGDTFGWSVSISGDTALVGARNDDGAGNESGSAYVYVRVGGVWTEQQRLTAFDAAGDDHFGSSVSVSGDIAVVGAPGDDDADYASGSAYVFVRSAGGWVQQQKLTASDAKYFGLFGTSVAVDGDRVLVGARADDDDPGSAYIFRFDPSQTACGAWWCEEQKLTASDGAADDRFGWSVALNGDAAVVGAYQDDDAGGFSGSAYVFRCDPSHALCAEWWCEEQKLTALDAAALDRFGVSVSISGDTIVVGAYQDDASPAVFDSGSAYIFVWSGGAWTQQQRLTASDEHAFQQFGYSVSVSGDTLAVGALVDDEAGADSGSAYVFVRSCAHWAQQQELIPVDSAKGDRFGSSIALSGDTVLAGAYLDNDAGIDSGSAYAFVVCANADGDRACDADDACPCTPPCTEVDAQGRPLGDFDADCAAELGDLHEFTACLSGPGAPPVGECAVDADLDDDGDVDLWDCRLVQLGFTGSEQP